MFAAFLLLLGLTTATAASFDVQAEDITSFSTSTSISVPDPPTRPGSYFLRGAPSVNPGSLEDAPTGTDPVRTKEILPENVAVKLQTKVQYHHSWETPPAAGPDGLRLLGPVELRIFQNGNTDRLTAGLFDCEDTVPPALTDSTACDQIGDDRVSTIDGGGYVERLVRWDHIEHKVAVGRRLRLQIVNRVPQTNPSNNQKWSVQWGYKTNRPSRLDVTLEQP